MGQKYSVTVFASSNHPKDWGRAMAHALEQLLELLESESSPHREQVFGRQLRLSVSDKDDGAEITLSCDPPTGPEKASDTPSVLTGSHRP